ncbi:MAG: hypothetical protein U5O15_10525 [Candidatus Krumholzibacteriota bacterium]|nr:hypothetical protein [Candidatus Krumholzibacteriota bacterium]
MRKYGLIILLLLFPLLIYSCIFEDDSLAPNQPPKIVYFSPDWQIGTLRIPSDSVRLNIKAVDPEKDNIRYSFVIIDSAGGIDSVLSDSDSAVFCARDSGIYNIEGRAYDSDNYGKHNWFIQVNKRNNVPPVITEWTPGSKLVQFVVGSLVNFSFKVSDDHPENLVYGYKMGGITVKPFSAYPKLSYRFLQNGSYYLEGIAFDGEYADTVGWDITISGDPDTIAPAGICDLNGHPGNEIGTITLNWTTPGDDGYQGNATRYIVRTSTIRIMTELAWNQANDHTGEPIPLDPGVEDSMVLRSLHPGEMVYVSLRAYDEFGNISPLCSSPHLRIRGFDVEGRVIDGISGEGVQGVIVSSNNVEDTSLQGGPYKLENLTLSSTSLTARDELDSSSLGDYYDFTYSFDKVGENLEADLCMVPIFPLVDAKDDRYTDFLDFFKRMTNTSSTYQASIYRGWGHWPLLVYNPPVVCDGVDLRAAAEGAMAEWESITGIDLFTTTENVVEADVEILYDSTTVPDDYVSHRVETVEMLEDDTPGRKVMFIYTLLSSPSITNDTHVIYTHEFGHVIGLHHSLDEGHIMIGLTFPKVEHVSTDESNLVKILYNLPPVFDSDWIVED